MKERLIIMRYLNNTQMKLMSDEDIENYYRIGANKLYEQVSSWFDTYLFIKISVDSESTKISIIEDECFDDELDFDIEFNPLVEYVAVTSDELMNMLQAGATLV